jgi:leukotriene-A4 hydrolase
VTNHTWEHFWLNEGLTVFIENKIIGRVWGDEAEALRSSEGWLRLEEAVEQ